MRMIEIIDKKRHGKILSRSEIRFFIDGIINKTIPDYQTSALLMAIAINGMTKEETYYLTGAMRDSGDLVNLSQIKGIKVDKHSTGGVGDKTSLVLLPMVAACGATVAKMSGRGLGHTGGTLDKLESIPGLSVNVSEEDFIKQVNDIHLAIIGQTASLAPADKILYALRDVTATVDSMPLIASSVMSKKVASGTDTILLDVTVGKGAFIKDMTSARQLAKLLIEIGKYHHKDTRVVISNMNEPLGYAIGNNLEIKEVIDALANRGPSDLMELCLTCGSIILKQAHIASNDEEARWMLEKTLENGSALNKFKEMVKAQGGDISYIDDPSKFKISRYQFDILSTEDGYIIDLDALTIGKASMMLGAGREKIGDSIDMSAGIYLYHKVGDYVNKGDKLLTLYTSKEEFLDKEKYKELIDYIYSAYKISFTKGKEKPLILEVKEK